ncbi:Metal-dependent hydrolase [Candidatus Magnetomoraceae bacterium gMMP-1]
MDTFSHGLWGYALFGHRGYPKLALLFGVLPDLLSFGVLILIRLINGTYIWGKPDIALIPQWTFVLYDCFHSLFISLTCIALVTLFNKRIAFAMLAWVFHIFLDIPFHSVEYFPTKMIWPLSDFVINGIPWSTPFIWFSNIAGLIIVLSYRLKVKNLTHKSLDL